MGFSIMAQECTSPGVEVEVEIWPMHSLASFKLHSARPANFNTIASPTGPPLESTSPTTTATMEASDEDQVAAIMGFSSFGDQRNKRKFDNGANDSTPSQVFHLPSRGSGVETESASGMSMSTRSIVKTATAE